MTCLDKNLPVLSALRSGVVPADIPLSLMIGRKSQLSQVVQDLNTVKNGGGAFRIITAPYGGGKSFFLSIAKQSCFHNGYVIGRVELSGDRRLVGNSIQNLLGTIICSFTSDGLPSLKALLETCLKYLEGTDCLTPETFKKKLSSLESLPCGVDLRQALCAYYFPKSPDVRDQALRWLQAQLPSVTEAKKIGCVGLAHKFSLLEMLQAWSLFFKDCGRAGLFIFIDEGTLTAAATMTKAQREATHDQLVHWVNELHSGCGSQAPLGIYLAMTPEAVQDAKRGLGSSQALRSRLETSEKSTGPVINLPPLSEQEYKELALALARIYFEGRNAVITENDIADFYQAFLSNAKTTPPVRRYVKKWLEYLEMLESAPSMSKLEMFSTLWG